MTCAMKMKTGARMAKATLVVVEHGWELWGGGRLLGRLLSQRAGDCNDYLFLFSERTRQCHRYFLYQTAPTTINRYRLVEVLVGLIQDTDRRFKGVIKATLREKVRFSIEADGFVMYSKHTPIARAKRTVHELRWELEAKVLNEWGHYDATLNDALNTDYRDWVMLHPKPGVGHVERINFEARFNYHSKSLYFFPPQASIPDVKWVRRLHQVDEVRTIVVGLFFGHPFAYAVTYTARTFEETLALLREALCRTIGFEMSPMELHLQLVNVGLYAEGVLTRVTDGGKTLGYLPTNAVGNVAAVRKGIDWSGSWYGFPAQTIPDLEGLLVEAIVRIAVREEADRQALILPPEQVLDEVTI
jgi:hypothetical protein